MNKLGQPTEEDLCGNCNAVICAGCLVKELAILRTALEEARAVIEPLANNISNASELSDNHNFRIWVNAGRIRTAAKWMKDNSSPSHAPEEQA